MPNKRNKVKCSKCEYLLTFSITVPGGICPPVESLYICVRSASPYDHKAGHIPHNSVEEYHYCDRYKSLAVTWGSDLIEDLYEINI